MRKLHRILGLVFAPFLLTASVTGLLWAYAPHLYLKLEAPQKTTVKASRMVLYAADGSAAHTVELGAQNDVTVDQWGVQYRKRNIPVFHQWIMKIHRLEFFGTKKELTAFPGVGLLLMLFTGIYLLRAKRR